MLILRDIDKFQGLFVSVFYGVGADHLHTDEGCPHLMAENPEGLICDSRHRTQNERIIQSYISDLHFFNTHLVSSLPSSSHILRASRPAQ